jgi:hypothetical protein
MVRGFPKNGRTTLLTPGLNTDWVFDIVFRKGRGTLVSFRARSPGRPNARKDPMSSAKTS